MRGGKNNLYDIFDKKEERRAIKCTLCQGHL